MYEKTVLDNGLRILTSPLPHTRAVSISVFVGAGSRYEEDNVAGISHLVEHMLFKGTERRPLAQQIAQDIEGVGGMINAATDKEATVYWAKVPVDHFEVALDVLMDQLLHSRFDAAELERERKVVMDEIAMVEDNPGEIAALLLDALLWPEQPLGRDVAGTRESVQGLSREMLLQYVASQYVPKNVVVSVAGDLEHDRIVEEVVERGDGWKQAPFLTWQPARDGQGGPRVAFRKKRTEQAQMALGYPGYSAFHPDRYALDVMNAILGDGMSSRLFVEIRENRGLAYSIHSHVIRYLDTGAFGVGAAVEPRRGEETSRAIRQVLEGIRASPVPEEELGRIREYLKGRLLLRMEDSRAVASWVGGQELLRGQVQTIDDVVKAIDAVSPEDILRVAQDVLRDDRANLAIVGPYRDDEPFRRVFSQEGARPPAPS